jgi:hypothetical protein
MLDARTHRASAFNTPNICANTFATDEAPNTNAWTNADTYTNTNRNAVRLAKLLKGKRSVI